MTRAEWFLGIIAIATLTASVVQIVAILYVVKLLRRTAGVLDRVEQTVRPQLEAMARDAARATAVFTDRVESADRMVSEIGDGVDRAIRLVQRAASAPAREGAAVVEGVKAAVSAFREIRERQGQTRMGGEEEEDLFIG